jgi:xanthine dehydrogenase YagS FAD-binding subunit
MMPFTLSRADDVNAAVTQGNRNAATKYLGGGTNLVDLMKMGVEHPGHLIDINRIPLATVEENAGGIRIGALVRNSDLAAHPLILQRYPLLSQALLSGASPQIRNMATVGGNLLQRTRCFYFYDPTYKDCNKRVPGSGCAALNGYNRIHAILGASDHCIAVHPSDMAVALTALDARIVVASSNVESNHAQSGRAERSIPIANFYRLPGDTPQIETELKPGELITAVDLPAASPQSRAHYLKVRDRNSYAFALVSVAAQLELDGNRIKDARIALGGVALKPWRVLAAEQALRGKQAGEPAFREAADILVRGAKPHRFNAFKIELARRATVRALSTASQLA